jgi:hypothetical protein
MVFENRDSVVFIFIGQFWYVFLAAYLHIQQGLILYFMEVITFKKLQK